MDFHSLLNTASKNAKNVDKTLADLDSEVAKEKKEKLRRIEAEKMARMEQVKKKKAAAMARREPTPEKKFTIPKKKNAEPTVDREKLKAFMAKKEEEKKLEEKRKQQEKEKLIQMRLQTFGGKANKKISKHFGMDPMDIQIRYGNDHQHVERLQKQKWREEDEHDMMASQYRGGVYKAIQQRNKVLEETSKHGSHKEPHRVSTSKANSLAGLSSRHASSRDHFSPPRNRKPKETSKNVSAPAHKKRAPAPAIDFGTLMKAASDISQGKNVNVSLIDAPAPKVPRMERSETKSSASSSTNQVRKPVANTSTSTSRDKSSISKSLPSGFTKPSSSKMTAPLSKRPDSPVAHKDSHSKLTEKPGKKDGKGRFVKGPSPPPAIPAAVPGKRYLPGDVRYKQQQEMLRNGGMSCPDQKPVETPRSLPSSRTQDRRKEKERSDQYRSVQRSSDSSKPSANRVDRERAIEIERKRRAIEKHRQKRLEQERWDRMSLVERERERDRQRYKEQYGDEEEEDDDYDSDMDDFIDDTLDIDDFSRQDFEETLRMVNPKYDKKKWKHNERMISDRDMESNFRTISKEEARSARLGFMEDLYEAKKRNSEAI